MLKIMKVELYKLFTGKKLYILSGVLLLLSLLTPLGMHIAKTIEGIDQVPVNGQSLSAVLLAGLSRDIIPILIIILAGGFISDEMRDGTLKQLLIRPIKRWELISAKAAALTISIIIFLGLTWGSGYVTGTIIFGWGEGFLTHTGMLDVWQGLVRTAGAYMVTLIPLVGFGLVVLLISQMMTGSGAVIGISFGIYFAMMLAGNFIKAIRVLLITEHFTLGFRMIEGFAWKEFWPGMGVSMGYILLFGYLSLLIVEKRDIMD